MKIFTIFSSLRTIKIYLLATCQLIVCLGIALGLSSCSVVMAAKKEGTNVENIQAVRTRGQIISQGAAIISSERLSTGELVEVYQFKKEKGSAARAFMHGVLDVSTLGLWEVVGTPVEVCMSDDKYFVVKVYYDEQEYARKMELL